MAKSHAEPIFTESWGNEGKTKVKHLQRVPLRDQTNLAELNLEHRGTRQELDRPFDTIFDSVRLCANIEIETQLDEQAQGWFSNVYF